MEVKSLASLLLVVFVLMVVLVAFAVMVPEIRDKISGFSSDFLGLGFVKSDEEIRAAVELIVDSLDRCSAYVGSGCKCDAELDIVPGDNNVLVDNGGGESEFILVNENQQVDATWSLDGRKVGVPAVAFDDAWNVYCNFDSFILSYDSGWHYRLAKVGSETVEFVSSDDVSLYPVIKLDDGNFCFIDESLTDFEIDIDYAGGRPSPEENFVKIGALPEVEGTFLKGGIGGALSDYYSGEEFFNKLDKCEIARAG